MYSIGHNDVSHLNDFALDSTELGRNKNMNRFRAKKNVCDIVAHSWDTTNRHFNCLPNQWDSEMEDWEWKRSS